MLESVRKHSTAVWLVGYPILAGGLTAARYFFLKTVLTLAVIVALRLSVSENGEWTLHPQKCNGKRESHTHIYIYIYIINR